MHRAELEQTIGVCRGPFRRAGGRRGLWEKDALGISDLGAQRSRYRSFCTLTARGRCLPIETGDDSPPLPTVPQPQIWPLKPPSAWDQPSGASLRKPKLVVEVLELQDRVRLVLEMMPELQLQLALNSPRRW